MPTWHAEITLDAQPDTAEQETLTAALPGYAVITTGTDRTTVALTVDAGTVRQAVDAALRAVTAATRATLGRAPIRGVRVLGEDDYRAEVEQPASMDLVGSTEGAQILGVSRSHFEQLASSHPDFPSHVAKLARGRVYTRASVEAFGARWTRKRTGRPRKTKPST